MRIRGVKPQVLIFDSMHNNMALGRHALVHKWGVSILYADDKRPKM